MAAEAVGLSKTYRKPRVVDLSSVRSGGVTGFLRANGVGKATALRVLLGLAAPTAGQAVPSSGARSAAPSGRVDQCDPPDVEHDQRAEPDDDRRERVGAPPEQGACDHDADGERLTARPSVLDQHHLEGRAGQDRSQQDPVPPHPKRCMRWAGFVPDRPEPVKVDVETSSRSRLS